MGYVNRPTALIAPCLLLASCMLGPDYTRPTVTTPEAWRQEASAPNTASLADLSWWNLFADEELRDYLKVALEANDDLRIAVARVDQSRARLGVTRAAQFPQLDADGRFSRQRFSQVGTTFYRRTRPPKLTTSRCRPTQRSSSISGDDSGAPAKPPAPSSSPAKRRGTPW